MTSLLFAKNQFHAIQDVGLHIKGTELRSKSEQTAKVSCTLASLTEEILDHLGGKRPLLMKSDEELAYSLHAFDGSDKDVNEFVNVFQNIKDIAGEDIAGHHFLSTEEIAKRG